MKRKWWTLTTVSVATSMLLLDITVVNVALPSIQTDRGSAWGSYVERNLIGPVDEPDYSKWETELMYPAFES